MLGRSPCWCRLASVSAQREWIMSSYLSLLIPSLPSLPSPLSLLSLLSLLSPHRKREKQLEEEIKKASEERESLTRSRSSSKDDRRGSRKDSASSDYMGMDETPAAPSISPATPFHSIVRGLTCSLHCYTFPLHCKRINM